MLKSFGFLGLIMWCGCVGGERSIPSIMIGGLTAGHRTDLEKLVFSVSVVWNDPDEHWQ
ncbi:MAG: hypothetical protein RLN96_12150 [Pseudomonadales bacterium]